MAMPEPPVIEGFTPAVRPSTEGFRAKFVRKFKENPFVPVGCLVTGGVLTYGLIAFKRGRTQQSQILMRARIGAQGFTVAALIVGVVMAAMKSQPRST